MKDFFYTFRFIYTTNANEYHKLLLIDRCVECNEEIIGKMNKGRKSRLKRYYRKMTLLQLYNELTALNTIIESGDTIEL